MSTNSAKLVALILATVAATGLVYSPQLLTDSDEMTALPPAVTLLWLALLLSTAPFIAWAVSRTGPRVRIRLGEAAVLGVSQVVSAVGLVRLDVWLEVRSGYLVAGSGEEAMAYGIGTVVGVGGGLLLAVLVTFAAALGGCSRTSREG